jgi:hypothetical protein
MVRPWYKGGGRYGIWWYIYGRNMVVSPHARRCQYGAGCGCGGITKEIETKPNKPDQFYY